jgi:hypothetical protein
MVAHASAPRAALLAIVLVGRLRAEELGRPAPDDDGASPVSVRVSAGLGGVGLHPLGGRVDRLGASASGLFVEGFAGVPLGPLVLGGSVDAFAASRGRVRNVDDDVRRVDRALVVLTAGPVLHWYPWGGPSGLTIGLGPRAFWVPAQPAWGDVARLPSQAGAGAILVIGHGSSLPGGGTIGAVARVVWGTTARDDTGISAYQMLQLTLGASVSFP